MEILTSMQQQIDIRGKLCGSVGEKSKALHG